MLHSKVDRETIDGMYLGSVCTVTMLKIQVSVYRSFIYEVSVLR